jgi:UDP-N-acetylglucosamine 2-epimerase (non-hydrolysing)
LVTAHRRENIGQPLINICTAVRNIDNDISIVWPVHPNPAIHDIVYNILGNINNIHLVEPLDIMDMHNLMNQCDLILTDSGGVQEEAPYLGKQVLILRDNTERIESGILVGTDVQNILNNICFNKNDNKKSPYGDGHAAERIIDRILGDSLLLIN